MLLAGVGAAIASAYLVITTYSPLPHWDEWALFDHLATGRVSLHWLWAQHNEHRIFVPKLFFLADVYLFRGRQIFLLAGIFVVQLFQIALLSWSLRVLGGMRGSAWRAATGLIAYCVLCPTQYENLTWGFQLQFVIPAAMATAAILSLLLYMRRRSTLLLALSIAAATIATWSLANGMLLWPLLVLTAIIVHARKPEGRLYEAPFSLLIAATINIGLYFFHYHRPAPDSGVVRSVGEMLKFTIVYFGSTFIRHSSGAIAITLGIIGLAAAAIVIVRTIRQPASPLYIELSFVMLFCVLTAAITSTGRLHLGLEQATASRYQTFALLFWCCLGVAIIGETSRRPLRFSILVALLLAAMLGFATQLRLPLIDAQWRQLRLDRVSDALASGVNDPAVLADAYPDPQTVLRAAAYLNQQRLSIFGMMPYANTGQPLESLFRVAPATECSGYLSDAQSVGDGLRVRGFAFDNVSKRPARRIIATTSGVISGFGTNVSIPLSLEHAGANAGPARFGWVAFVNQRQEGPIEFYAILENGRACPFARK